MKQGLAQDVRRRGELPTLPGDILKQQKDHSEELLHPANTSSVEEAESKDSEEALSISLAEVSEVIKRLVSGKEPGVNEIRPEMLKDLDIFGQSWLTHLFNVVSRLGTVPVYWQTKMVVPI